MTLIRRTPPKNVRVKEAKLGREHVHADVTYTDKKALIRIDPRQNGLGKLDALIHELLHLACPEMSEGRVRKTATYLAKGLWREWYRKQRCKHVWQEGSTCRSGKCKYPNC